MAEELSRITRPPAGNYQGKRKLLLAPLINLPMPADAMPEEGLEIMARYWAQVDVQVRAVQNALGSVSLVYHEHLPAGGQDAIQYLESTGQPSHALVKTLADASAVVEPVESMDALAECLDLQRCLMQPLMSMAVANKLQEWLGEATRRRYEYIAEAIDKTLPEDGTALLLINERHQVQFPVDLEVIYIAPPALDEYRRWLQNWTEKLQQEMAAQAGATHDDAPQDTETSAG